MKVLIIYLFSYYYISSYDNLQLSNAFFCFVLVIEDGLVSVIAT